MLFGKRKKKKSVSFDWHQQGQRKWEAFIETCEGFENIQFKDGCATGYKKGEVPGKLFHGTGLLIPYECITIYEEN